jgi:tRNA modification GTPase
VKHRDTILAPVTAQQNAAVGILRLSGPQAKEILCRHFKPSAKAKNFPNPWQAYHGFLFDENDSVLDEVLALYFAAPKSFTGEDVVEFHLHGNQALMRRAAQALLFASPELRPAQPGEFSRRAFANGKFDLTEAEALHALITSESEAGIKAALSSLDGALSRLISDFRSELVALLALVEAGFEFPEEDIQTFDRAQAGESLSLIGKQLTELAHGAQTGKALDHGLIVALIGEPNTGKSTLLNALLVEDRAIVSDVAGTTRDVIEGILEVDGFRFRLRDTAGLNETPGSIEAIGIKKTQDQIEKSDVVLLVTDDPLKINTLAEKHGVKDKEFIVIFNKIDRFLDFVLADLPPKTIPVSAFTGKNVQNIREELVNFAKSINSVQNSLHINARQAVQLSRASSHLNQAKTHLCQSEGFEELICEELRLAIKALEEIIGLVTTDNVLDEIFSKFCIGK